MSGVAIQSFLFGATAMNALWHPSAVTIGLLPVMALLLAHAIYIARRSA